jgi:hypothetical protein
MDPDEIIVHREQRNGMSVVFNLLGEGVCQAAGNHKELRNRRDRELRLDRAPIPAAKATAPQNAPAGSVAPQNNGTTGP